MLFSLFAFELVGRKYLIDRLSSILAQKIGKYWMTAWDGDASDFNGFNNTLLLCKH
jgi:hypothetical protein